ncbi:MAG: nuclear transport factor 2 family protein [Solirubrobacteraceae bacterium]
MDDAIARYRAASEANDMDALMSVLAADVRVISPISGSMVFRGSDDVRFLLSRVYSCVRGLRWTSQLSDGSSCVLVGEGKVAGVTITDAMVFELSPDGRIASISPHLRPWLALSLFALLLGPRVARRPGAVLRALRAA